MKLNVNGSERDIDAPDDMPLLWVMRDLMAKGEGCFGVVVQAVAACLGLPPSDADVQRRAYMLWSFVHGHSFLTIDMKHKVASAEIDDWNYLLTISRAVLGSAPATGK